MFSKFSIGIYFSNAHAYLVCLENTFSGIKVKKHELIDFIENDTLVQQIQNVEYYIKNFIETIQINDTEIHIGFPRNFSIVRTLEFPLAVKDDLSTTIKYSLEKYIPVKSDDLFFDYTVLSENKEKNTIKVILAAAKKDDLKPFIDLAVSLETGVSGVHVNSTAIINYLSFDTDILKQNHENLFVFHKDKLNLDIVFFKNNQFIYSKCVQSDDDETLFELINSQIYDPGQIQKPSVPVTLVLCGKSITKTIRHRFEDDPNITLKSHEFTKYNLPSEDYMTAFGLALNGFMPKNHIRMNLLPAAKRKKPSKTGRTIMFFLIAMVLIFGVIFGASIILNQQMVDKKLDAEISRLESDIIEITNKKAEIEGIKEQINTINRLTKENISINDILSELSRIIPAGSYINVFDYNMTKGVKISGQSDISSDLIPLLEESPLFKNCVFLSAITKDNRGKERFFIGFEISSDGSHE